MYWRLLAEIASSLSFELLTDSQCLFQKISGFPFVQTTDTAVEYADEGSKKLPQRHFRRSAIPILSFSHEEGRL